MTRDYFLRCLEREHDVIENTIEDERERYEAHIELEREARQKWADGYSEEEMDYWLDPSGGF